MKVPRFRIAWVMVFVAIAALDFGAIRAVFDRNSRTSYLLGIGALPMANVLVVGLLIGHRRRGSRRFLLGFEAFGAMALAVYVTVASLFTEDLVIPYLRLSYNLLLGYTNLMEILQSYFVMLRPHPCDHARPAAVGLRPDRRLLLPWVRNRRAARPRPAADGPAGHPGAIHPKASGAIHLYEDRPWVKGPLGVSPGRRFFRSRAVFVRSLPTRNRGLIDPA